MAKRKAATRRRRTTPKPKRRAAPRVARRKSSARKRAAKKRTAPRAAARKAARKKTAAVARRAGRTLSRKKSAPKRVVAKAQKTRALKAKPSARPVRPKAIAAPKRRIPGLDRERRAITDKDEFILTPPSSLNLDRSASAARSGRRELHEKYEKHTETGPAMTGGDIDADWESAYSVGDEAPGGDNPTPDQDIVDDIGRAVGVEYQDNEELKGERKILERDKHRWELDPASAEDYEDR